MAVDLKKTAAQMQKYFAGGLADKGTFREYFDPVFKIPGAEKPADSSALKGAYTRQMDLAQQYAKDLEGTSDRLYNPYAQQARSQLPGMIQKTRGSYNSRGLLHSGKARSAEAGTVQNLNQGLAEKRAQINQQVADNLAQLEGGAFNAAGMMAQPGTQTAFQQLQGFGSQLGATANQNVMNAQLIGSLLGGGAAIGGAGLAGAMQQQGGFSGNPNAYTMGTQYGVDYNVTNPYGVRRSTV